MNASLTTVTYPRYVSDDGDAARAALWLAYDNLLAKVRDRFEEIGDDQFYAVDTTNALRYYESRFVTGGTYDQVRIYRDRVELVSVRYDHVGGSERSEPIKLDTNALTIQGFADIVKGLAKLL